MQTPLRALTIPTILHQIFTVMEQQVDNRFTVHHHKVEHKKTIRDTHALRNEPNTHSDYGRKSKYLEETDKGG